MIDPEVLGKHLAAIVKSETAPLLVRIDQLEKQLDAIPEPVAPEEVDVEAIAKAAADMVQVPEPDRVDVDAIAKAAAELVPTPTAPEPVAPEPVDVEAIAKQAASLITVPKAADPLPAPTVDEIAAAFERRFSDLTLSWERQARDTFEKAADRMPVPKDGRDAIPLDGLDLTLGEDGRTVTVKMQAGETILEKSIKLATVIDRGVFKSGGQYEKGDAVSYGGSLWIAQKDAPEGVPGAAPDWRLSVKKGRDGKDLRESASRHDPAKALKLGGYQPAGKLGRAPGDE